MADTPFTTDQLRDALDQYDLYDHEAQVRTDYSGRGMFGDKCFGITTAHNIGTVIVALAQAIATAHERDAIESGVDVDVNDVLGETHALVKIMRTDSMGLDVIVYFPGWTLPE